MNRRPNRPNKVSQPLVDSKAGAGELKSSLPVAAAQCTTQEIPAVRTQDTHPNVVETVECLEQLVATAQFAEPESSHEIQKNTASNEVDSTIEAGPVALPREVPATPPVELVWAHAIDAKLNALIEQSKAFERERIEIESLREQLSTAIESAESRLGETNADSNCTKCLDLERLLIEAKQDNAKLSTLLLHSRNEYQTLIEFIESEPKSAGDSGLAQNLIDKAEAREIELKCEIAQLGDQIQFLQTELKELRSLPVLTNCDDAELRIQIETLRSQLLEARHEAVESRMQNNELGTRLAKFQGPAESQRSEALSWEQRKEALLQQLEAESSAENPIDPRKAIEIEKVIQQTDAEIDRRDREIADLRSLLEQQSFAHNGMAVGVAAVAEMIESDGLIIAERERLQELQKDWEQKQRQAEIEMSLERAKLARERLELQEKLRNFEDANPPQTEEEKKSGKEKNRGRWLARLGLRDE